MCNLNFFRFRRRVQLCSQESNFVLEGFERLMSVTIIKLSDVATQRHRLNELVKYDEQMDCGPSAEMGLVIILTVERDEEVAAGGGLM
jgi:hypothetical protein